ncbi:class IV adenylate cyclase [Vibrio sp. SM6]|uniref:Class IV adenylate cyclase n=1 Tax=Vibrio agarilyticus TaxID=2726741 RepID=A0A7X8TUA1_9VIBR|nr:class IV adenylate cyclase [Vibrio agarilyticus]
MSQDHFKGRFEVELKYRLTSKNDFLAVLQRFPYEVMVENNLETDWHFDSPSFALREQNKSIVIRQMQPSGILLWIVKGPEPDRCQAVNISDALSARSMLETMGYQLVMTAQKTRSIYFLGEFHITLDSLEGIGEFAEFAIMTDDESRLEDYRKALVELAKQFGLTENDRELSSYKALQHAYQSRFE